ncbi:MAG: helix-turn-helix domain-containing protein [Bdellovibrionaceae bacterium]|nr:helix-turn-helix domain-containing protein [Pseudobdellovibrionaceae bacterium]
MESDILALVRQDVEMTDADLKLRSLKIKRWLRTNEVALYLGTSQGAIRNMVLRGQLKAKKCFGRNFFDKTEIDAQMDSPNKFNFRRF